VTRTAYIWQNHMGSDQLDIPKKRLEENLNSSNRIELLMR